MADKAFKELGGAVRAAKTLDRQKKKEQKKKEQKTVQPSAMGSSLHPKQGDLGDFQDDHLNWGLSGDMRVQTGGEGAGSGGAGGTGGGGGATHCVNINLHTRAPQHTASPRGYLASRAAPPARGALGALRGAHHHHRLRLSYICVCM